MNGQQRVEISYDEYQELLARLESLENERQQMADLFARMQKQQSQVIEDALKENPPLDLSPEELERARQVAEEQALRRVQALRTEVVRMARDQFAGPKYAFTPSVDDVIPIGGARYRFEAGVPKKYPRIAIDAYENRRRQLAHRETLRVEMGATPAGQLVRGVRYGRMAQILKREMGNV